MTATPPPCLTLDPPLINTACPWATTLADLRALYLTPHTGAVTTRTSLLHGFPHNPTHHQHHLSTHASHNTYGYSPNPLSFYLTTITTLLASNPQHKPFIVSITGTPSDVATCIRQICAQRREKRQDLWIELNLSCPNIPGAPPPAYERAGLKQYLDAVAPALEEGTPFGLKVPPYTYRAQLDAVLQVVAARSIVRFVTACNTLGGCLLLASPPSLAGEQHWQPALSSADGTGIGGMGGEAVHSLALGNVKMWREGLDAVGRGEVLVVGVGGVGGREGAERMWSVGAGVVGVATALGREGVEVFGKIRGEGEEEVMRERAERLGVPLPPA